LYILVFVLLLTDQTTIQVLYNNKLIPRPIPFIQVALLTSQVSLVDLTLKFSVMEKAKG